MELGNRPLRARGEDCGFSLLEVIIASVVLTIGLLTIAAMFTSSLAVVKASEEDTIARHEAQQMIEGIFAARNTGDHPFSDFQSVAAGGIFVNGYTQALRAGPDGIMNTGDDGPALETGPDGKPLANFQRQIVFNTVLLPDLTPDPNTRQIVISIQYRIGGLVRTYTEITYISTYR
jgi:prepilin-type N-terminal cleavage/methylation domain-containing protein